MIALNVVFLSRTGLLVYPIADRFQLSNLRVFSFEMIFQCETVCDQVSNVLDEWNI